MSIDVRLLRMNPENGQREEVTKESPSSNLGYLVSLDSTDQAIKAITGCSILETMFDGQVGRSDWHKMLSDLNAISFKLSLYKSDCNTFHSFEIVYNSTTVHSPYEAAELIRNTIVNQRSKEAQVLTDSGLLLYPEKDRTVVAIVSGHDGYEPCTYVVYKTDLYVPLRNLQLAQEACKYVLAKTDPENYIFVKHFV